MALHKFNHPKSAALLFRVLALQRKLLKAFCEPNLLPARINVAWLCGIWPRQDPEWVRKFCLGGSDSVLTPIKEIAAAPVAARQSLLTEFERQNRVQRMLDQGGDFRELGNLPGFTAEIADAVKRLFGRFYDRLSHKTKEGWKGYEFPSSKVISNENYKDICRVALRGVCPYCDDSTGTPDLDHYYAKSRHPLLACSPWNVIPVCKSCNNVVTGKGDDPALDLGPPASTEHWLHPVFRPASPNACLDVSGPPAHATVLLRSPCPNEQRRLDNHVALMDQTSRTMPRRELSRRWKERAEPCYGSLVTRATTRGHLGSVQRLKQFVKEQMEDFMPDLGSQPFTMMQIAVCQAILDGRAEWGTEFFDSNPPTLQ